jgi:hypothetical protein
MGEIRQGRQTKENQTPCLLVVSYLSLFELAYKFQSPVNADINDSLPACFVEDVSVRLGGAATRDQDGRLAG